MTYQPTANDILMGASNAPAWKFDEPGTTHEGVIVNLSARQEREYDPNNPGGGAPKVFPSGDPIMGVIVEVQTTERDATIQDDDGRRTFYCEGRYLKQAVRDAVRYAKDTGLDTGGRLKVTFTHREDPMDKRSRKYWTVIYTPPGNNALMNEPTGPAEFASSDGVPLQHGLPASAPPAMTAEQAAAFAAWQQSQGQPV